MPPQRLLQRRWGPFYPFYTWTPMGSKSRPALRFLMIEWGTWLCFEHEPCVVFCLYMQLKVFFASLGFHYRFCLTFPSSRGYILCNTIPLAFNPWFLLIGHSCPSQHFYFAPPNLFITFHKQELALCDRFLKYLIWTAGWVYLQHYEMLIWAIMWVSLTTFTYFFFIFSVAKCWSWPPFTLFLMGSGGRGRFPPFTLFRQKHWDQDIIQS